MRSRFCAPYARFAVLLLAFLAMQPALIPARAQEPNEGAFFDIRNASSPAPGVLFAGQPTAAELKALAEAGYRVILDLRTEAEDRGFDEPGEARNLGLTYVNLPINVASLQKRETLERFNQAFSQAERPVLVHCGSSNRVGALYYAYLITREGADKEQALEKAKKYGLRSQSLIDAVDAVLEGQE